MGSAITSAASTSLLDRRKVLAFGALGFSALQAAAQPMAMLGRNWSNSKRTAGQHQFDIAIVGAGVAGLAAAKKLQSLGRSVVVLEAANRVGGRAFTDAATFSVPVDLGCSWLHQADRNPLTCLARRLNFTLVDHERASEHFMDRGVRVSQGERDEIEAAFRALERRMAGVDSGDASMASLLTAPDDWVSQLALRRVAELDTGGNAEETSVLGVLEQGAETPNWLVQEGMGRIVESLARGVRVGLNARVSEIEQQSGRVKVVTSVGDITAQHCIVTVSTGVLRSETIRFKPGLGNAALAALDALPMGHFNKVVLEFDGPMPGFAPGDWLSAGNSFQSSKAMSYVVNPFASNLIIALAGGSYGQQLATLPTQEAVSEVMSQLKNCLGTFDGRKLTASRATDWSANALFHGGYAYLRTGGGDARKTLSRAGTERIHFAGEATAIDLAQTCGGSYLTGIRTAERIDAVLRQA